MVNVIAAVVLLAILGVAVVYVVRARKRGQKCIGCPNGCCPNSCNGSGCNGQCGGSKG